jgi:hypothetical protein
MHHFDLAVARPARARSPRFSRPFEVIADERPRARMARSVLRHESPRPRRRNAMSDLTNNVRKTVNETLAEIEQIADEIRVRLHLGGMDAKDAWRKLEPQLDQARQHAQEATDASSNAIQKVLDTFKEFKASLLGDEQTNPGRRRPNRPSEKTAG